MSFTQWHIKTYGHVSVAKKDVWHTSVLFTETAILLLSSLVSLKLLGQFVPNFTYFMPSIYMTSYTNLKKICSVVSEIIASRWFLYIFLLCTISENQPRINLISFKFSCLLGTLWPIFVENLEMFKFNSSELWMIILLKTPQIFSHTYSINPWW